MAEKKTIAALEQTIAASEARTALISLFDEDTFVEVDKFASAKGGQVGVITGYGQVDGSTVFAFAQDVSVKSGAVCEAAAKKIAKIYAMAVKNGAPVVGIYDSKGGDISEGTALLGAYGEIADSAAKLSGVVPQIAVVTGVCGGTMATIACMADLVIMTEKAEFFMTAPFVAQDKVAGAGTAKNAALSGTAAIVEADTAAAIKSAKKLISVLPANNLEVGGNAYFAPCEAVASAELTGEAMVKAVADKDSLCELYKDFGKASFVGLGSINWKTVGFVATNKTDDRLSADDTAKIARFVSFCDAFSIPVVTFVDTEGYEATSGAELMGSVRNAARLTQIYAGATTVKIAVITGNALGGGFTAFCGRNADYTIALEEAVIAPATPAAAATFLYADGCSGKEELAAKVEEYAADEASPFTAAGLGLIDRVIAAEDMANAVNDALEVMSGKRVSSPARKHMNFVY